MKLRGVMKNLNKAILLFCIMINCSFADDLLQKIKGMKVVSYSQLGHENNEYEAIVTEDKADHLLKIFNQRGDLLLTDSYPILTDAFRDLRAIDIGDEMSPYIVVTTQRGIHGENLIIYSLSKRKMIKNFTSTMPITWQAFENHLDIQTFGPKQQNGEELKQNFKFPIK